MRVRSTKSRLEEEKKKKKIRRFIGRSIIVLLLLCGFIIGFVQVYRVSAPFVTAAVSKFAKEYLRIREVSLVGASEYADKEIMSFVQPLVNETGNIFQLPVSQIQGFLFTRRYLKKAEVRIEFPGRVVIEVVEKRPVAMLVKNGLFLLDENGEIVRQMSTGENIDIPAITVDKNLNEKLEKEMIRTACYIIQLDGKSLPLLMPSELSISGGQIILRSLELKNKENSIPPIYLGLNEIEKKIVYVKKLWPEIVNKKNELEYVDGRFSQGVLVKLKTTEVKNNG